VCVRARVCVCESVCAQVVREIPVEIVKEIPVYIKVDPTEWDSRHNLRSSNMTSAYPTGIYVKRMNIYIGSQHERDRETERQRDRETERQRERVLHTKSDVRPPL